MWHSKHPPAAVTHARLHNQMPPSMFKILFVTLIPCHAQLVCILNECKSSFKYLAINLHSNCWLVYWYILIHLRYFLWLESYWSICSGVFCRVYRLFVIFKGQVCHWSGVQMDNEIVFYCCNHSSCSYWPLEDPLIVHLPCKW